MCECTPPSETSPTRCTRLAPLSSDCQAGIGRSGNGRQGRERDEDQAREESDIVNYLLFEEYDGYTLLQCAIKDALLNRNCTVKVYWDDY